MLQIMKSPRHLCAIAMVILGYSTTPAASWAQSQPTNVTAPLEARLEEIIVTAQKRTEKLQDVPISAQVIGSQTLAQQNFNALSDLSQTLPAVHIGDVGSSGAGATTKGVFANDIYIRGIGSGENPSFDQSVAMFVDDIYHGRSRMSNGIFLDLDRIEVLKGPQSTFFGNNAIAGALNIVTRKPSNQFDAWGRLLYGEFGTYAAEGAVGGPISDTFGVRLAVTRNGMDEGWLRNVSIGQDGPRINNQAARLTAVYKPNEDLDGTLKLEGSEHRTAGAPGDLPGQWTHCPPPPPFAPSSAASGAIFGQGGCTGAVALGVPIGLDNNETTGQPGQGNRLSTFENVLTVNYHLRDQTLTSVSGFYNYHSSSQVSQSGLPLFLQDADDEESYHQFSQELRVASAIGGPIEYLAGIYFQTDRIAFNNFVTTAALDGPFAATPYAPFLPLGVNEQFTQGEHVYSIFGSLQWNVTNRLKLNAGLRGSSTHKDITSLGQTGTGTGLYGGFVPLPATPAGAQAGAFATLLGLPTANSQDNYSDRALLPSAGVQYQVTPEAMLYLSYNKGFKSGGFDGLNAIYSPPFGLANHMYGPEHVNAFELGLKSKWFDDRLLINLDVFRSDYKDLQVTAEAYLQALTVYTPIVVNAASSRSQGVEFETQWAPTKELRLSANVTYLDSYYVNFPNAPAATLQKYCHDEQYVLPDCSVFPNPVPVFTDISGQPTNFAPKWSGSVIANYSLLLPGNYRFITELSPYLTSAYYTGTGNDPYARVAGYARLDGRLAFQTPDGRWGLDLIGKNLTNRIIVTDPSLVFESKQEPRNIAFQVRYHW
jgi:iron complex outermembrane receptor protein